MLELMQEREQQSERPRLSGRRAEAARNDPKILAAARAVFVRDPSAPMAAVAREAGVGVGAVYRRFASKEELLQRLCADGLRTFIDIAHGAEAEGDPGRAFEALVTGVVDADVHSLTVSLAGTFTPTAELGSLAQEASALARRIVDDARSATAIRPDLTAEDFSMLLEQVTAVRLPDPGRTAEVRRRYVALHLDAWRHVPGTGALPGSPPTTDELNARWVPPAQAAGTGR
jgi:AcrR family transcriptional regulator